MKKLILIIIYVFMFSVLFTVDTYPQYEVGKHYAGPSIGLSFLGSTAQLGLNYEYAFVIKDFGTVGAGGIFRYWSYKAGFFDGSWSYTNILIGGQFNYHFKMDNKKFDPWAGAVLAYDAGSVDLKGSLQTVFYRRIHHMADCGLDFRVVQDIGFHQLSR